MRVCCLDLEGVLVPEIWIRVAETTGISDLRLTTRDIKDYDELMRYRLKILKARRITLRDIQKVIAGIAPLKGAGKFLNELRSRAQVIILSDTFNEFAAPLMRQLGWPTIFCHDLEVGRNGFVTGYRLRQKNSKAKAVKALKGLKFEVTAAGDSYNDLTMLAAADRGILFNPPPSIRREYPRFPVATSYQKLLKLLLS